MTRRKNLPEQRETMQILQVMTVGEDARTMDELEEFFFQNIRGYTRRSYSEEIIYRVSSFEQAKVKIDAGAAPDLVIFPENFPETKRREFRDFLSLRNKNVVFVFVPPV